MSYSDLLLDPRWQKKRLEVLNRSRWKCEECGSSTKTLHVHHRYYVAGRMPWEYPDACLQALCKTCHSYEKDKYEDRRSSGMTTFDDWEIVVLQLMPLPMFFSFCMDFTLAASKNGASAADILEKCHEVLRKEQSKIG